MVEIRKLTFEEISILQEFKELTKEYAEEGRIEGIPSGEVDYDTYRNYEKVNILHIFGAFTNNILIGFIAVIVMKYPHRSIVMATTEAIFVTKEKRNTGAGTKLIERAEEITDEMNCLGNIFIAPVGSVLDLVLPRRKYKIIQHIHLKVKE